MTTYDEATRIRPGLQKSRGASAFLAVSVHGARGLSGRMPYGIIKYGTRENERTQRVTPCFRSTTTPMFEEHFLFEHDSTAWAARRLTVVLFDSRDGERRLPTDKPLGKVRVHPQSAPARALPSHLPPHMRLPKPLNAAPTPRRLCFACRSKRR